jgi:tetratricopeptide (TPR) repeat protein
MYDKVLTTADEVLKYKPDHVKTYYFKGVSHLVAGNKSEAIKTFQYVLSLDSAYLNTNKQLGFVYYNEGSAIHDKAKVKYNGLKKPSRTDYHNYRMKIEESIIPYKTAIPYLETCFRTKASADVKSALNLIYARLGQKENAAKYK